MERYQEIERSLIKKYRKEIWSKFIKAIKDYKLIEENDKIMVCISGGKDSFVLAKCIQEVKKHGKINFEARFVCMNPGYAEKNKQLIIDNAKEMNIPLEMFESDIFEVVDKVDFKSPCYMCAKMRRGHLYAKAQEIGCNKIALGHHFDDVIETTLLSMFYGAEIKTMLPKLHSDNFKGVDLIRPLYLVKEDDIKSFTKYNELRFLNCACKFTAENYVEDKETKSKRYTMKQLIKKLREEGKDIDHNIFKAMDNVNLSCILGTKKDGEYHSFLEDFDK